MSARLECWSFNGQQHCGRFPCCFWKQFFKFRGASWGGFVCFVLPLASSDSNGGPARPLSLQGRAEPQWRPARSAEEESGAEVVDFVWRCGCCCRRRRRRRRSDYKGSASQMRPPLSALVARQDAQVGRSRWPQLSSARSVGWAARGTGKSGRVLRARNCHRRAKSIPPPPLSACLPLSGAQKFANPQRARKAEQSVASNRI